MAKVGPPLDKLWLRALAVIVGYIFSCVVATLGLLLLTISEQGMTVSHSGGFLLDALGNLRIFGINFLNDFTGIYSVSSTAIGALGVSKE
jgi:hypothetical protein